MTKFKKIILHVGVPKTASTSIQYTLRYNESRNSKRYFYPKSLSIFNLISMFSDTLETVDCPQAIRWLLRQTNSLESINRVKNSFYEELNTHSFETLIISSEYISSYLFSENALYLLKEFLLQLCQDPDVQLLVFAYVRNPLSFYTSGVQQLIQWGEFYDPELNKEPHPLGISVFPHLKKIINVFGEKNTHIYRFEDGLLHQYGPVGFFLEHILQFNKEEIQKMNLIKKNTGVSQIATDLCNYINFKTYDLNYGLTKVLELQTLCASISGDKFKLSTQEKLNYLPQFIKDNHFLKEAFGIEYSMDDIFYNIEQNIESCHIPSRKNLFEITQNFCKVTPIIQDCIIEYLEEITRITADKSSVINTIKNIKSKQMV